MNVLAPTAQALTTGAGCLTPYSGVIQPSSSATERAPRIVIATPGATLRPGQLRSACAGRQVPAQVVAVGALAGQPVLDDPVGAVDEDHAAAVDGLVARAAHLAGERRRPSRPRNVAVALGSEERERAYGVWSAPSTVTVLCAAVPRNQWRRFGSPSA